MRHIASTLSLALLLVACNDSSVFDPRSVEAPSNTFPAFTPDSAPDGKAILMEGKTLSETEVDVRLFASWTKVIAGPNLETFDLLLRIDSGAQAEVELVGTWCGSPVSFTPTAIPGEWRLLKSVAIGDCSCWGNLDSLFLDELGTIKVRVRQPGTWRVSLAAGSTSPVCECGGNCPSDVTLSGGSLFEPSNRP